jgi:hypothetical protein
MGVAIGGGRLDYVELGDIDMSAKPAVRVTGAGRRGRLWRAGSAAAGLAAVGLLTVACSASPASPGVASDPSSSASVSPSASSSGSGGLAFAACMRSHGVPNFPDPSSNGGTVITPSMGINTRSPQFISARNTCARLIGGGTSASSPQNLAQELKYSKCMRAHGVPNFPDPSSNGAITGSSKGINPQSPTFQNAQRTCQKLTGFGNGSASG